MAERGGQLPCLPSSSVCNHGEGQEGERVRHARLHHPPEQAVVWRHLQEARAAGREGGEEVRTEDDEDQVNSSRVCGLGRTELGSRGWEHSHV